MSQKDSLWLPVGYGKGTIVYDLDNTPYEVGESLGTGADIYKINPVSNAYAKAALKAGAKKLMSVEEKK